MARKVTPPRARQQDLEGMAERAIKPLEELAESYADVRDRRMALTTEEAALKQQALALLRKFDKTIYKRNGIEIRLVPGEESIVVKVKKPKADEREAD